MVSRGPGPGGAWFLRHVRLLHLVLLLIVMLVSIPLLTHHYLSSLNDASTSEAGHKTRRQLDHSLDDLVNVKIAEHKFRIEELKRIKASVNNELRDLESKRQKLHQEISGYTGTLDRLKTEYEKANVELQQLKATIESTKLEQQEMIQRKIPELTAPQRLLPSLEDNVVVSPPVGYKNCHMWNCWDYSRCSITSQFPVYLYDPIDYLFAEGSLEQFLRYSLPNVIGMSPHMTYDPNIACVYIVIIGDSEGAQLTSMTLQHKLHSLPHWKGDGRNHVLVTMSRTLLSKEVLSGVDTGRALVAQSHFDSQQFRPDFDLVISPNLGISSGDIWDELPSLSPAHRKHLLTFQGSLNLDELAVQLNTRPNLKNPQVQQVPNINNNGPLKGQDSSKQNQWVYRPQSLSTGDRNVNPQNNNALTFGALNSAWHVDNQQVYDNQNQRLKFNQKNQFNSNKQYQDNANQWKGRTLKSESNIKSASNIKSESRKSSALELVEAEQKVVLTLKTIQSQIADEVFRLEFRCHGGVEVQRGGGEWSLCRTDAERRTLLLQSTFALILAPVNTSLISTLNTQVRIYEALKYGAIPVILGPQIRLPLAEILRWKSAAIVLPKQRVSELHYILQSISDGDILEYRRQGRMLFQTYLGTSQTLSDSILAVIRTRLNIPAFPTREEPTRSVFNETFQPLIEDLVDMPPEAEEMLGPMEDPLPSPRYRHNHTLGALNPDPFHLYPYSPFTPVMPAEAKFIGSALGFRPIGRGEGGAGKEFHEALGGNHPREQFTIVMLTYERELVLINALRRLKGLPHLYKVLVVWNSPRPPSPELKWPDIGVKVVVVKTNKNSLNNRFLPYAEIETEAVLSIDDDAHLRQDEITFGFRVWREARDRIVGFPGRFHAWDNKYQSWLYNSNHSCELSMVLTGAAFFHKYYAYLYSYVMPQAIRDKVDEYMNCEDLALNFLVSHITRQPPIKVTSRWTFRCPGCPQALSEDDSHFQERHKCINFFTSVYGYMPLLNTQFRADSVLFKTRIPHDKQKCFKFI